MEGNFYSLNEFLRERHGEKVIKLSIDGGFTCPNRDGTVGTGGCIFCSSNGSGDFASDRKLSIYSQLEQATTLLQAKWPHIKKYIAYFQSYSNTYDSLDRLKERYETALQFPGVVGISIATRPDCLTPPIIDYLEELSHRTHLWVELGLQSIHPTTTRWIRQGYSLSTFDAAVQALAQKNIETVVHLIVGFPEETEKALLETASYVANLPLQGVKIHMLHILKDSPLGKIYHNNPFPLPTEKEYIYLIGEILKYLPPTFVIHRVTGDGAKEQLLAPLWTLNKRHVLNSLHAYLKANHIYQGQLQNKY